MRVAAIVVTYNDEYKYSEWVQNHKTYKDELYMHIIVDNGSQPEFIKLVEQTFTKSHIIKRNTNGGCTAAYNDGIRLALSNPEVDGIMLIGNDFVIEKYGVSKLYAFLHSDSEYGMVAPTVFSKDSEIVESYGCTISKFLMLIEPEANSGIDMIKVNRKEVDTVGGGMNLAKRGFYETVGLQDEALFMYSDEVDMGLRAKKVGYKMAVTKNIKSWHQHINPQGLVFRNNYAPFLGARNKVYLAKKHFGITRGIFQFLYFCVIFVGISIRALFSPSKVRYFIFSPIGAFYGLINNMKIPKSLLK